MSEFDVKFAAYESMMKRNNNFGMSGDILARYYGDYSVRLQEALNNKEQKAFNKEYGRLKARQIAEQRAADIAKYDKVFHENIAPTLYNQPQNPLLKGITYGQSQPSRFVPEVKPHVLTQKEVLDFVYKEQVAPAIDKEFGQSKNPLLKGITYGQSQPSRFVPEVKPHVLTQKEVLDFVYKEQVAPAIDKEFGQSKNPLLESIKPNRDFRGQNLIGEKYTEAQKILHDTKLVGTKGVSRLAKYGKWGAAVAGVVALGAGAWALLKGCDNNNQASQNDNPLNKPIIPSDTTKTEKPDTTAITQPIAPSDSTQTQQNEQNDSTATINPVKTAPADSTQTQQQAGNTEQAQTTESAQQPQAPAYVPLLTLDSDGSYTTQRGDSFWRIAKKHLKDKFKAEGIDRNPTNAEIQKETERIMNLNSYGYDKNHWFSDPMLHPNVKLSIETKLDKAA